MKPATDPFGILKLLPQRVHRSRRVRPQAAKTITQQLLERLAEEELRPGQHRALAAEYCALSANERDVLWPAEARVRSFAMGFALVERAKELQTGDRAGARHAAQLALTLAARRSSAPDPPGGRKGSAVLAMDLAAAACSVLAEAGLVGQDAEEGARQVLAAETYLSLGSGDPNLHAEVAAGKALLLWSQGDGKAAAELLDSASRLLERVREPTLEATMRLRQTMVLESLGLAKEASKAPAAFVALHSPRTSPSD